MSRIKLSNKIESYEHNPITMEKLTYIGFNTRSYNKVLATKEVNDLRETLMEFAKNYWTSITQKSEEIQGKIKAQINKSALAIETGAKIKVKTDQGRLNTSILAKFSDGGLTSLVGTDVDYAPFVEFGTKSKVEIPAGLEAYAMQFKGSKSGSWDDLVRKITAWARRNGIEEEAIPLIAMKIAKNGVKARPFLFPAVEEEKPRLISGMEEAIK